MASLLSIKQVLDDLDGAGPGSTLVDVVTKATKWHPRCAVVRTKDWLHEAVWAGEYPGAKLSFTLEWLSDNPDPAKTLDFQSTIEIITDEGGNTQSVLSFRRRRGWDTFGLATARLSFQANNGEWRYNVLGYPHPLIYNSLAIRFVEWWKRGATFDPKFGLFPGTLGGRIRTALHLLELAADPIQGDLAPFPAFDTAERKLADAVKAWKEQDSKGKFPQLSSAGLRGAAREGRRQLKGK